MTMSGPRLRSLLRQAEKTAAAGKRQAAEEVYRQIIEESPESEAAWLGLAQVVADEAEQKKIYVHVLTLNADNEEAITGLARLRGDLVVEKMVPEPVEVAEAVAAAVEPDPMVTAAGETAVAADAEAFELFCYRHPNKATGLRCYTCSKPICIKCAVKTPVGYRCPDCVRELEDTFYGATSLDYLLAVMVTMPLSVLATLFIPQIGFFLIFVAPLAGGIIGQIAFRVVRRRRGRWLPHTVAGTIVLTALATYFGPAMLVIILSPEASLLDSLGRFFNFGLLWVGLFIFLTASTAYYRMR